MTVLSPDDGDKAHWAQRFADAARENPDIATDEQALAAWFGMAIMTGRELAWDDLLADEERAERVASSARQRARTARLAARYGRPEHVCTAYARKLAAAAQVPVDPSVEPDDIWASIYRDAASADAYAESNLTHHGHPTLAKVPLPDGRVLGILDLRPSLERARREAREEEL